MKIILSISLCFSLFFVCFAATAAPASANDELAASEARQALSDILDIWRDERYIELYERTISSDEHGEYYFLEKMVNSLRKPACCWEKLKDVKTAYASADRVILIATVGMELDGAGTKYVTRSFSLTRVNGVWKIPMESVVSLSDSFGYRSVPRDIIDRPLP